MASGVGVFGAHGTSMNMPWSAPAKLSGSLLLASPVPASLGAGWASASGGPPSTGGLGLASRPLSLGAASFVLAAGLASGAAASSGAALLPESVEPGPLATTAAS